MKFNKKTILKFSFITLLVTGLVVGWLGFGDRGFIHLYRMEMDRQAYLQTIGSLESENEALLEEIDRLLNDEEYIISVARRELGLIKDGEVFYRSISEQDDDEPDETWNNGAP